VISKSARPPRGQDPVAWANYNAMIAAVPLEKRKDDEMPTSREAGGPGRLQGEEQGET